MKDFIRTRKPLLSLRMTSFTGAMLVAVSWSHAVLDGLAFRSMLEAWALVLRAGWASGKAADPLASIPTERHVFAEKILTGWAFFRFALRYMWALVWQAKVTNRTLVLPVAFMVQLRTEARRGLPANSSIPLVSNGDVLCAW
ncbi:shikimate O-hydroxycinnamoyltransferase [Microdochium nivale]|nr:shikimate O-hydroxycinnamoyltransferase [Microdochium nivale]